MRAFFFVGSKRSGTTVLVKLLNEHPRIYCANEYCTMWSLYYINKHGNGNGIHAPHGAGFRRMVMGLERASDVFLEYQNSRKSTFDTRDAFFRALQEYAKKDKMNKNFVNLAAIGEKNPAAYASPEIRDFILGVYPKAKFVHIVRHPAAVARSRLAIMRNTKKLARVLAPDFWSDFELGLKAWVKHEQWVQEAKKSCDVFTLKYESLCKSPADVVGRLYTFLGVSVSGQIKGRIADIMKAGGSGRMYDLAVPDIDGLKEIMQVYGYET